MYDYIIVGAGSAGCVLANRLSENPDTRVLLIEAGKPDKKQEIRIPAAFSKLFKTAYDWDYETEPQRKLDFRKLYIPRGKTLGGSSSINAMLYIRGHRAVYDKWRELGNVGWGFDDVLPYFIKSEKNSRGKSEFHGEHGELFVSDQRDPRPLSRTLIDAAIARGITENTDFNGASQDGAGLFQVTQKNGMRSSAATAFLKPILDRENLDVITGGHVTNLTFDGRRTSGVQYQIGRRKRTAKVKREVLLCGGAINSPQILMLSGIGTGSLLQGKGIAVKVDLPGVGENLQDHLAAPVAYHSRTNLTLANAESIGNVVKYLMHRIGPLSSTIAEACIYVKSQPDLPIPNLQFHFAPNFFFDHGFTIPDGHGFTLGPVMVTPKSRGYVRLKSNDPFASPEIQPNYCTDPEDADMTALVAGIRMARKIINEAPFDLFRGAEMLPGESTKTDEHIRAHIRKHSGTLYHPVGTCTMGHPDDIHAVVDSRLRVYGVHGLRVVDASIMPIIPNGNTNAPTIMIAEKAADMILADSKN